MSQFFEGYEHSRAEMNDMRRLVNEINNNTQESYEQNEQSYNDLNAGIRSDYKKDQINQMIQHCLAINKAMTKDHDFEQFEQQTEESYQYRGGMNVASDHYKDYTLENIKNRVQIYSITDENYEDVPIQKIRKHKKRRVQKY